MSQNQDYPGRGPIGPRFEGPPTWTSQPPPGLHSSESTLPAGPQAVGSSVPQYPHTYIPQAQVHLPRHSMNVGNPSQSLSYSNTSGNPSAFRYPPPQGAVPSSKQAYLQPPPPPQEQSCGYFHTSPEPSPVAVPVYHPNQPPPSLPSQSHLHENVSQQQSEGRPCVGNPYPHPSKIDVSHPPRLSQLHHNVVSSQETSHSLHQSRTWFQGEPSHSTIKHEEPDYPWNKVGPLPPPPPSLQRKCDSTGSTIPEVPYQYVATEGPVMEQSNKTEEKETEGEYQWIPKFELQIMNRVIPRKEKSQPQRRIMKLLDVKCLLQDMQDQMQTLKKMQMRLKLEEATLEDSKWQKLVQEAEMIKMKLNDGMMRLQDEQFLQNVRKLVEQRRKKRSKFKRKKQESRKQLADKKIAWQREEELIDQWREKLHREEVEKRREKSIKKEADSVLGEVRQKQADATRMQQLLESLITLRMIRSNKGEVHGYISTPQSDKHFLSTTKAITEVVSSQMKEYKLEEQTLCVMMEESSLHHRTARDQAGMATSKFEAAIHTGLFGNRPPIDPKTFQEYTAADHSLEALVHRRREWDQFITEEDSILASAVPLHWVNPPADPTPSWAEYQK